MKTFDEVFKELQPQLEEVEEFRLSLRQKSQTTVIIGAVILLVSIIIGLMLQNFFVLGIGSVVGIIVGAAGFFSYQSKYKKKFKAKVVPALLEGLNPGMIYKPKGHIDKAHFKASGIFQQSIDRYSGEDYIKGVIGKTDVEFSELHAQYKSTTTDSKGRTRTSYHTFFKGLYMIADFHKDFQGRTLVLPDNAEKLFGGVFGKWFQKMNFTRDDLIYMEDPEFEKQFVVYGTDQIESRYILSTHMMRDILELKQKCNCPIFLSFNNSVVHLAIYWSKNLLEPNFGKEITQSSEIQRFYDELSACFQIVEDLNLNTRIWTKQ